MEKILQQLLEGQAETTKELKRLAEGQTQVIQRLDNIDDRFEAIEHRLEFMDVRLNNIDVHLENIDGQLGENTRFIHALSQDVARTATKDSIDSLNSKFELLNDRLFQT